jgi:futalosine hydrolase
MKQHKPNQALLRSLLVVVADAREAGPKLRFAIDQMGAELFVAGVGKVAATLGLTLRLQSSKPVPDAVFIVGVAGAFDPRRWRLGDLAWVEESWLADDGVETDEGFRSLDDLGLGTNGPFRVADRRLADAIAQVNEMRTISRVGARTVSTCSGSRRLLEGREACSDLETMESAALAAVCLACDRSWVELRAVSNFTGPRDASQWNLKLALANLDDAAARIVETLLAARVDES